MSVRSALARTTQRRPSGVTTKPNPPHESAALAQQRFNVTELA
jgi:hypothetical protein